MKDASGISASSARCDWKTRLAAASLVLAVGCSWGRNNEQEAAKGATAFYDVYMELRPSGVPGKEQQLEIKKVLSTGLANLLFQAAETEENSANGGSPSIEGDLFTSLDQGAVSYKVLQCETRNETSSCTVELSNIDDRDNSKFTWKDRAILVREANRWVVDDIEYLGGRQFMHKGHLRDVLNKIIEDAKKGVS